MIQKSPGRERPTWMMLIRRKECLAIDFARLFSGKCHRAFIFERCNTDNRQLGIIVL